MSAIAQRPRHRTTHQSGHLAGALVDIALLVVINVSPGWRAVPVLTDAARGVVAAVDTLLAVALVVNVLRLLFAGPRLIRAGEVISTAAGLTALLCVLVVFPFHFTDPDVDWATVTRLGLVSVVVVVSIALMVQLVRLAIAVCGSRSREVRP
jgi:drug/metabolite transporter (DMT)-like permease